jgi:hypothetical protein
MQTTTITVEQNEAADTLLEAMRKGAALVPDTGEGSPGHLRDDAVRDAQTDLDYIRTNPTSAVIQLRDGDYLTIEDWLEENATILARWCELKGA